MCCLNRTRTLSWRLSCVLMAAGAASAQTTWYVDDDNCPGPGSGTVGDPFCSIQDGIDAALDMDEVVVRPGLYDGPIDFSGKAITLRSTNPADPAVVAATIIDATGLSASVVRCVSGVGSDTVLDGLTITGGTGDTSTCGWPVGGGMYNLNSSPTVNNCTFSGNGRIGVWACRAVSSMNSSGGNTGRFRLNRAALSGAIAA